MSAQPTVLTYDCRWAANVMGWSSDTNSFRLGVGSFMKTYANRVDLVERDPETQELVCRGTSEHSYPATKLQFTPSVSAGANDMFVTTGDYLRLWQVEPKAPTAAADVEEAKEDSDEKPKESKETVDPAKAGTINSSLTFRTFNNNKSSEFCSPLTSCDWNSDDPKMVGACSIDTTVSIWDLEKEVHTTQLIAHDKEVFDIAFAQGTSVFSTCGADGSLRVFDTRELEHCTIVFEAPDLKPLLRCSWNKLEGTYISTFAVDGTVIYVVDVRYPSIPVARLSSHTSPINSMMWAPHSASNICSAGEDKTALIWDLGDLSTQAQPQVVLNYTGAPAEINTVGWSSHQRGSTQEDWIAITCGKELRVLKV